MTLETRATINESKLTCNNQNLPCLREAPHAVIAIRENANQKSSYQRKETKILKEPSSEENVNKNNIKRLTKLQKG